VVIPALLELGNKTNNEIFSLVPTDSWSEKWTYSEHPGKEFGKFVRTSGKFFNDAEADKGE
jgi:hypothetical protein